MSTLAPRTPRRSRFGWNLLGLLVFLAAGFPVYWMVNTAFKPAKDAIDPDPSLLPTGLTLDNFRRALDIADFWGPVGRSLIVSLSVIWDMGVFPQVFVMRNGHPEAEFQLLTTYSYDKAFVVNDYAQGSAIALLTVLLLLGVIGVYMRQMLKIGEVE